MESDIALPSKLPLATILLPMPPEESPVPCDPPTQPRVPEPPASLNKGLPRDPRDT